MEGVRIQGKPGVREYWIRQWAVLDPMVEPVVIEKSEGGRTGVHVHQLIKDKVGVVLADRMIRHVYTLRDGLIVRMDIEEMV